MAWYDQKTTGIKVNAYDPTSTRKDIDDAKSKELANTGTEYKNQQKMNMDQAFTDTVEKKKVVGPNGEVTYSLFLDPDKYSSALFQKSKETGVPFDMDAANEYGKYALGRMQNTTQMAGQAKGQEAMGLTVEGKPNATRQETTTIPTPKGNIEETRKDKNGKTWMFDGVGWYDPEQEGQKGVGL